MDESHDPNRVGNRDEPACGTVDADAESNEDTGVAATPDVVGDGREKHVHVVTQAGDRRDHGNVYLRHSTTVFFVSPDESFPEETTTHYEKSRLTRVEVTQHHSMCFITTATAGEVELDALRGFRDATLVRSSPGRALVTIYEAVSPPIATTLARHPHGVTTRLVRRLVRFCAMLARRQKHASPPAHTALSALLVVLYVSGVGCAALGHTVIRLRERR